MKPTDISPQEQMMKFILGKWISQPICIAAELGIADILDVGPLPVEEIARQSNTHTATLYRVMRALAGVGIFAETEGRVFELSPMGEYLKSGAMGPAARMVHSPWNDKAWSYLMHSVKTGESAFEKAHGKPIADWLKTHPEAEKVLSQANAMKAAHSHRAIVEAYDFEGIHRLTDVGGGYGALMAEILDAFPLIRGRIMDLPTVVQGAEDLIKERGLEDRCNTVGGDFFKEVPAGDDAYLLSHILHDWPDDTCRTILSNCRSAMETGAKLLVVEMVVPPGNQPSVAKLLDLEMLVITGGRERTLEEYRLLFEAEKFEFQREIPTKAGVTLLECSAAVS
ncbi:MAG: methyltransferase [bacterium]|nr:methyltransferase [bacterium]